MAKSQLKGQVILGLESVTARMYRAAGVELYGEPYRTLDEMLAEIQLNHPEFSNTPIIMLTAMTDRENTLAGLQAGADDYLTKPVDLDLLMAKISGCIMRLENNRKMGRGL